MENKPIKNRVKRTSKKLAIRRSLTHKKGDVIQIGEHQVTVIKQFGVDGNTGKARNGMANVYLVEELDDLVGSRKFVVKQTLSPEKFKSEVTSKEYAKLRTEYKGLVQEARFLNKLTNVSHIPKFITSKNNKHAGSSYILMEYIDGPSLVEYTHSQPDSRLSEEEAVRIIKDLAKTVGKLHASAICYRDMKPENVIIPTDGKEPHLIDFGISGKLGADQDVFPAGTKGYLAPEQQLKNDETGWVKFPLNVQFDIFGLGATLAFMLTGVSPTTPAKTVEKFDVYTPIDKRVYGTREMSFDVYQKLGGDEKYAEYYRTHPNIPDETVRYDGVPQTVYPLNGSDSGQDDRALYPNKTLVSRERLAPLRTKGVEGFEYYSHHFETWQVDDMPNVIGEEYTSKSDKTDERDMLDKTALLVRVDHKPTPSRGDYELRTEYYVLPTTHQPFLTGPHTSINSIYSNPSVSPGLEYIIGKATHPDPSQRYKDIGKLIVDLDEYQRLGGAYTKKQNKRMLGVAALFFAGLGCLTGGLVSWQNDVNEQSKLCTDLANTARNSGHVDDYVTALDKCTSAKPEVYSNMVDAIASDGSFTKEEESKLIGVINTRKEALSKESGYGELAFNIGKLYMFYYQSGKNTDSLDREGVTRSATWFKDAKDQGYDPDNISTVYAELADFHKTIGAKIQEGNDKGAYKAYWSNLQKADSSLPATGKMMMYASYMDLINSYSYKLNTDGIPREEVEKVANEITKYITETRPSGGKQGEIYNYIASRASSMSDAIKAGYER